MDIDAIKGISLVDFLHRLGYDPTGRDSKGLWFYAPYRNERKPSFHVNPRKNVWFDFGTGEGGDIFTLAGALSGKTDFVEQAQYIAEKMNMPVAERYKPVQFVEEPTFENVAISRLESPALLRYLEQRGIPKDIAQRYCVQVDYELHGIDNDTAGRAAVARLRREFGDRVSDKSALYPDHKDLNDFLMSLNPKQITKPKFKL